MTRKISQPFLFLFATILLLMSFPKTSSEKVQGVVFQFLYPFLDRLSSLKNGSFLLLGQCSLKPSQENELSPFREEFEWLQLQNEQLKIEVAKLKELYQQEHILNLQLANFHPSKSYDEKKIQRILADQLEALSAKVIYRSPVSWNSSLWINVGRADNDAFGKEIISKNSPVLARNALIGVVDYVGRNQSRVRLITDPGLTPSVRALRGQEQNNRLLEHVVYLLENIKYLDELFGTPKEGQAFIQTLQKLKSNFQESSQTWHLAKGELHGNGKPLWRSRGNLLRGIGFNYDFADEYGPARDLRSGKAIGINNSQVSALPLIKVHDLLVTTGMDGVFPPGLRVAEVLKIEMLKEGDYFYELEAKPAAGNLDDISFVFVIPSHGYDMDDQPPLGK